ncbi:MAG: hypothetical protein IPP74_02850 [Alphaproteobacteria bacterium]|nr:hypothetical protein [Alphaproteobacteria bacterium]
MKSLKHVSLPVVMILSIVTSIAHAASANNEPSLDQTFGEWNVYTYQLGGKKTCYIVSMPKNEGGTFTKRGQPYTMVTHVRNDVDEVSVSSGYSYKSGTEVAVDIGADKYTMFSKGELAWAYDAEQDAKMVTAMKKASKLVVKGTSQRETTSDDTYSLSGFGKAYDRMKDMCAIDKSAKGKDKDKEKDKDAKDKGSSSKKDDINDAIKDEAPNPDQDIFKDTKKKHKIRPRKESDQ